MNTSHLAPEEIRHRRIASGYYVRPEYIAEHEAGHLIAAYLEQVRIRSASIIVTPSIAQATAAICGQKALGSLRGGIQLDDYKSLVGTDTHLRMTMSGYASNLRHEDDFVVRDTIQERFSNITKGGDEHHFTVSVCDRLKKYLGDIPTPIQYHSLSISVLNGMIELFTQTNFDTAIKAVQNMLLREVSMDAGVKEGIRVSLRQANIDEQEEANMRLQCQGISVDRLLHKDMPLSLRGRLRKFCRRLKSN